MRELKKMNQHWILLCLCVLLSCTTGTWADFTFGEPVNLGAPVNTSISEGLPAISADGLSLYFVSSDVVNDPNNQDIWVAQRKSAQDAWEPPTSLGPIVNWSDWDFWPNISADGLTLYFSSWRPGGLGSLDIWRTTRPTVDDDWTPPANLGTPINSESTDLCPTISANGLEFYFASDRHRDEPGETDLYACRRASVQDAWGEAVALSVLNSDAWDLGPSLSADGLAMFFNSLRDESSGISDIYMTTRPTLDADWSPPVNIGLPVNASYPEYGPCISSDGRSLYFSGNPFFDIRPGGMGSDDIWTASIEPIVDFTGDYRVDIEDLILLIEHWGQDEPAYDMGPMPWGDGIVDGADLKVLMSYWDREVYDPHLLAHWKLDETEGYDAADSAMGKHASVMGNALWQPEAGACGGTLQFDGQDDHISTPYIINPCQTNELSVFAWIKGGESGQVILSQLYNANWLLVDADGKLMTELKNKGRRLGDPLYSETVITDGNWHRIGLVWDGSQRILYVDDIEVARDSEPILTGSFQGLLIGTGLRKKPGTFWSGMIDDMRIYDRVVVP